MRSIQDALEVSLAGKFFAVLMLGATIGAQSQTSQQFANPGTDTWPTYNGDYSGKRFSTNKQINRNNAGALTMAWAFQPNIPAGAALKSTPLVVDGIMYFTVPDHVWAIDAHSGREIWHYDYPQSEGNHIGQRGVAVSNDLLYFETPDAHLVCLTARDGKMKWNVELADVKRGYWATMAPLVIRNHVIAGVSGDEIICPASSCLWIPLPGKCNGNGIAFHSPANQLRIPGQEWPSRDSMAAG